MAWTDKQIRFIQDAKLAGKTYEQIADSFNVAFDDNKTANAIRKTLKRYKAEDISEDAILKNLEKSRRAELQNRKLKKEQNLLLDEHITLKDVIDAIESLVGSMSITKYIVPKIQKSRKKNKMIIEPMMSDIHFGLITKSYNSKAAREALKKLAEVTIAEMRRYEKSFAIEKINLLAIGDIIQSATMHKDSHESCDMTNAEQIAISIKSIFRDFILPLAMTGIKIDVIGLCGNHDRERQDRYITNPGKNYFTFTIYKTLELLCQESGLKNVKFTIPTEAYYVYDIFGSDFLVTHGDLLRKGTLKDLEDEINKRSVQLGKIIKGIRCGHFHNDLVANLGRYIKNGSSVSDDPYGNHLGYKSRPCQIINYYVETCNRDTPYYHSLVVNLE